MKGWPIKNSFVIETDEPIEILEYKICRYLSEKFGGNISTDESLYRESSNYREFTLDFDDNSMRVIINKPQPEVYVVKMICGVSYDGKKYIPEGYVHNGGESKLEEYIRSLF